MVNIPLRMRSVVEAAYAVDSVAARQCGSTIWLEVLAHWSGDN